VQALAGLKRRLPDDAAGPDRALYSLAGSRIVDVMMERTAPFKEHSVLLAATRVRDEIAGKIPEKVEAKLETLSHAELVLRAGLPEKPPEPGA
jgi:hypothetical protein